MPLCEGDDEHEDGAEMLDLGEGVGGNSNPFAASIGNEVAKSKSKTLEKSSRLEGDEKLLRSAIEVGLGMEGSTGFWEVTVSIGGKRGASQKYVPSYGQEENRVRSNGSSKPFGPSS
jgi:hypothetical protein